MIKRIIFWWGISVLFHGIFTINSYCFQTPADSLLFGWGERVEFRHKRVAESTGCCTRPLPPSCNCHHQSRKPNRYVTTPYAFIHMHEEIERNGQTRVGDYGLCFSYQWYGILRWKAMGSVSAMFVNHLAVQGTLQILVSKTLKWIIQFLLL